MRVGLDVQVVANGNRSGLYTHLRYVSAAIRTRVARLDLLAVRDPHNRLGPTAVSTAFDGQTVALINPWRRTYRVLSRLSPLTRLDVLVHNLHGWMPPDRAATDVYVVPDIIPLGLDYGIPGFADSYRQYYETAVRHGAAVVVWSAHTRADLLARVGGNPDRVHVCPLAAGPEYRPPRDTAAVPAALAACGLADTNYVLCVATIEKRKNHAALLRAFARLVGRDPALRHKLVLVGGKWVGHETVFDLIAALGLSDRVMYMGYADCLPELYAGADVFVFPSVYEGFGLPPLEAMACGCPVLAANATALPEVVGEAGLLFPPNDDITLADQLERVLADPAYRAGLSAAGLSRAATFTWDRTGDGYVKAFEAARQGAA